MILTYNRLHHLISCLESVYSQDYPMEYVEVVVVDDGSTDGTREYAGSLRTGPRPVRYIRHPENRGVSATRNTGILHAKNEFICILADDYMLSPGYLENADQFFTAHPGAKALRFIIRPVPGANYWMRLNHLYLDYSIQSRIKGKRGIFHADMPASGAVIFHADVFQKTGLFNEICRGGEDSEFAARMRAQGIGLCVDTETEVFASFPDTLWASMKNKFNYGRFYYSYFRKRNNGGRKNLAYCYLHLFGQVLTIPQQRLGSLDTRSFIGYYPFMLCISVVSFLGFIFQSLFGDRGGKESEPVAIRGKIDEP